MKDYMPHWPLKILILSSDPRDADRLRLAQELRDSQLAIRGARSALWMEVFNEPACRYSDITATLDRIDPHILHFSGHGGEDVLYFEEAQGTAKAVKKQALASLLGHQKELQLVILNACFSLNQGQAFADAVGLAIVSEGSIQDQDAIDFSREFYTALGNGKRSYTEAFERAKSALEMTGEMKVHLLQRNTTVQDGPAYSSFAQEGNSFHVQFQLTALPVAGHFVHRNFEMEAIERHLLPTQAQAGRKTHVLYGLGGIGKTQLAIAHARKHQHTYSAIVQVNGNTRDTVLQSLSAFGRHAGLEGVSQSAAYAAKQAPIIEAAVAAVLRWLALEGNHRWLMIFDNVDRNVRSGEKDPRAFEVKSFLPPADHGSVLITTRLPSLRGMGQSTEVKSLKLDQAQELLSYHSSLHPSSHDMTKLIQRLGSLPLALVQAGTYMHKTKTNCSTYFELYEASWNQLAAETPRLEDYENGSIQTTWMISYERVRQVNLIAGKLLQLWGYLDNRDVWYELFHRGEDGCLKDYGWLQELAGSKIGFKRVMQSLLDYSLIESHGDKENYSMHPVVHDWCTETISSGQADMMLSALKVLGSAALFEINVDDSPEDISKSWRSWQRLLERVLPHARRCVRQIDNLEALHQLESVDASFLLLELGRLLTGGDSFLEGEKMYRLALHGFEQAGDPDHLCTMTTMHELGDTCKSQGKHAEAENMYLWVLGEEERIFGADHETTIATVHELGDLYLDQGKHAEAEKSYRRALVGFEKAWGPNRTTLQIVLSLGDLYQHQGSYAEAEKLYRRALDEVEINAFDRHYLVDFTKKLSEVYVNQGKHAEAEGLYWRLLDEFGKTADFDHPSMGRVAYALSELYINKASMRRPSTCLNGR